MYAVGKQPENDVAVHMHLSLKHNAMIYIRQFLNIFRYLRCGVSEHVDMSLQR